LPNATDFVRRSAAGKCDAFHFDWRRVAIAHCLSNDRRSQKMEANALAIKMTSGAGYDPDSLVRYIGGPQLVSGESRTTGMRNAIRQLAVKAYKDGPADEFVYARDEVRRAGQ